MKNSRSRISAELRVSAKPAGIGDVGVNINVTFVHPEDQRFALECTRDTLVRMNAS